MSFDQPLLRRELVGLLRTRRTLWLAVVLVLLSGLLPLGSWPGGAKIAYSASFAPALFLKFSLTQLTVSLLIVPILTAGAITGERERNTYELLYASLASPFSIALSKLLAPLLYVLVLLAATSPAGYALYLLGGISGGSILKTYFVTLLAVVSSTAVCVTISLRARRTLTAVLKCVFWVALYNYGIGMLAVAATRAAGAGIPVTGLSPYLVISSLQDTAWVLFPTADLDLFLYTLLAVLLTAGHVAYVLRAAARPDFEKRPRPSPEPAAGSPAGQRRLPLASHFLLLCGELRIPLLRNPLFLKEIRSEFFAGCLHRRLCFWGPLVFFAVILLQLGTVNVTFEPIALAGMGLLVLAVPAIGSSAFTREIEGQSLDLLRGTFLSLEEVFRAKYLAVVYGGTGIVAASALALLLRGSESVWILAVSVYLATLLFTSALSLVVSVTSKHTAAALVKTYVLLLLFYAALPLAFSSPSASGLRSFLLMTNPFLALREICGWGIEEESTQVAKTMIHFRHFLEVHLIGAGLLLLAGSRLAGKMRLRDE